MAEHLTNLPQLHVYDTKIEIASGQSKSWYTTHTFCLIWPHNHRLEATVNGDCCCKAEHANDEIHWKKTSKWIRFFIAINWMHFYITSNDYICMSSQRILTQVIEEEVQHHQHTTHQKNEKYYVARRYPERQLFTYGPTMLFSIFL